MTCLILSLLTPHTSSRYPTEYCSFIPNKIYTDKLPFIKKLPEMYKYQKQAIDDVFKSICYFSKIEKH